MRRSQWLTDRPTLSNWRTSSQTEEKRLASLSNQTETFSVSPLLIGGVVATIGIGVFGGQQVPTSRVPLSITQDLLDTLATEDLDPIVTEDEMDEITFG